MERLVERPLLKNIGDVAPSQSFEIIEVTFDDPKVVILRSKKVPSCGFLMWNDPEMTAHERLALYTQSEQSYADYAFVGTGTVLHFCEDKMMGQYGHGFRNQVENICSMYDITVLFIAGAKDWDRVNKESLYFSVGTPSILDFGVAKNILPLACGEFDIEEMYPFINFSKSTILS